MLIRSIIQSTRFNVVILQFLLVCGILAPLLYVGSDIIAGLSWAGYSFASQAVSELRGIGAPTRTLLVPVLTIYAALEIAFGLGIWKTTRKSVLHIDGLLLIGLGMLDLMGSFFAMNASESVGSLTNIIHIGATILTLFLLLFIIVFGSFADGKKFQLYLIVTLFIVIIAGVLTFLEVPRIAANLPTPWMGLKERISIYTNMIWLGMLALVLLREQHRKEKEKIMKLRELAI
jgi:hypothetical protein